MVQVGDCGDMESLDNNGKMQHDRAGSARHEDPVELPSRDVNRTQLRAGLQTTSSPVDLPLSLPQPPTLSLLDAGRSRADFLFGVRVALIGRDRPLLLTYFFSEGT